MLAVFVKSPLCAELREITKPNPGSNQIVLRMGACGICGTDIHVAASQAPEWKPLGHEVAGEVSDLGDNVEGLNVGDKVVLESSSFCGHCDDCRNGRVDLCRNIFSPGRLGGGFAEYVLAPAQCAVRFEGLDYLAAALAEPLGVALDLVKVAEVRSGERVLVLGPGPIGLMATRLCQLRGADEVVLVGRSHSKARLKAAAEMGATQVLRSDLGEMESLAHKHFHKALITSSPSVIPAVMPLMKFGAIMAFLGIDFGPGGDVTIPMNDFHFSRLQLRASHASPALFFPEALNLLQTGAISAKTLVTHVFPLAQFPDALRTAAEDKTTAIKVMIQNL